MIKTETLFRSERFAFDMNDIESSSNNGTALEKDEYSRGATAFAYVAHHTRAAEPSFDFLIRHCVHRSRCVRAKSFVCVAFSQLAKFGCGRAWARVGVCVCVCVRAYSAWITLAPVPSRFDAWHSHQQSPLCGRRVRVTHKSVTFVCHTHIHIDACGKSSGTHAHMLALIQSAQPSI